MGSCLSSDGQKGSATSAASEESRSQRKGAWKALWSRNSSPESKETEKQLRRIPGRMFFNGASSMASLFTQQGKKGIKQDAMIVWEDFGSRTDTIFCGVFDGHGPFGHKVAKRMRDSLPLKLSSQWDSNVGCDDVNRNTSGSINFVESASLCIEEEPKTAMGFIEKGKKPEVYSTLKESFLKAFKVMDKELRVHPNIDCFCSGTTAVTLVKLERQRELSSADDVSLLLLMNQMWLESGCQTMTSPGLATARAFGDFCLKDFGLISVPEISYRRLTEQDEFIVLATDGVCDVLSNKEVADLIASAPAQSSAAQCLVESASQAWRLKYPTSKIDDCAVVCLFLNAEASDDGSTDTEFTEADGEFEMPEPGHAKQETSSLGHLECSGAVRSLCETFHEGKEAAKEKALTPS